jgi:Polyketide cyclase / dehydrase and lipid transport
MADGEQTHTVEIEATLDDCVSVLLDFERYPAWSSPITSARVIVRDEQGRGSEVEFELDMKLRTVRYVLRYSYDLPAKATWCLAEGDVRAVEGAYEFETIGSGHVRATCRQAVDLGFWVPGPLRRVLERQALRDSVSEFKAAAEARARSR